MDITAVVGWLALAVVLNTAVTALLVVLILRLGLQSRPIEPARRGMAGKRRSEDATERSVRAAGGPAVGPGPVTTAGGADPLAGAIEAFLGRSDGLFRSGGPQRGRPPAPAEPQPAEPQPAEPQPRPAIAANHERGLSDVTWATSRPSRFVASGPHPVQVRADVDPGADVVGPAAGRERPVPAGDTGPPATAAGRTASRLSIALSRRQPSGVGADPRTVARLGPVVSGFLRERTRANDHLSALSGGRYSIVLPETSLDGAESLIQRLIQGCDAWLAAEEPPLRLEFGLVDLPAAATGMDPAPRRASGPERRQATAPRA